MPNALAMTTYLLPCTCSARVRVGAGEAGGTVTCPACAATLAVPKLRDFRSLELADAPPPAPRRVWNWRHACLLAGTAIAALGFAAAGLVGRPVRLPVDAGMIRAAVDAAEDAAIIEAWKALATSGVDRQPMPDEVALQRIARFRRSAATGLMLAGATGALGALAAGAAILLEKKKTP